MRRCVVMFLWTYEFVWIACRSHMYELCFTSTAPQCNKNQGQDFSKVLFAEEIKDNAVKQT